MRAPRPWIVIIVLMAWTLYGLFRAIGEGEIRPTAGGIGYLVGTLLAPVALAVLYVWWYRRRSRA
jgi:hypothetical protein